MIINQIFGNNNGFGIIPITFDWTLMTAFIGSPLPYPFFAIVNTTIGVIIFFLIAGLGVKYTGAWGQDYLPISSTKSFDNTGQRYNVSQILTPDLQLDVDAYKKYSPLFLGTFFTLAYGVSFGSLSSIIVHTVLFHGREIIERAKLARNQDADVHLKMMKKYVDTPDWWYYGLFTVLFALSMFTVLYWPTLLTCKWLVLVTTYGILAHKLTGWAMFVAMGLALVFLVPIGMIQGITNTQYVTFHDPALHRHRTSELTCPRRIGLNVLTEFVIGYMLPGRPIAMMLFKTYVSLIQHQPVAEPGALTYERFRVILLWRKRCSFSKT